MIKALYLLIAIYGTSIATTQVVFAAPSCAVATQATAIAAKIRGLSANRKVPCSAQNRDQVERYLRKKLADPKLTERLKFDEQISKTIGLIPADYPYLEGIIALYSSQVGGYYDSETKTYVMANWMPEITQLPIAVHEMTHALQDQHFNLSKFVGPEILTTDEQLARSALVEGDATAVMNDLSLAQIGSSPLERQEDVSAFVAQSLAGMMFSGDLLRAPSAIQATVIFPYVAGFRYVHALLRRGGYREVDRIFKNAPPTSTREILHPERSKSAEMFPPTSTRFDILGEFSLSTLFATVIPSAQAAQAADGLIADQITNEGAELVWRLRFSDEHERNEALAAFELLYQRSAPSKAKDPWIRSAQIEPRPNREIIVRYRSPPRE